MASPRQKRVAYTPTEAEAEMIERAGLVGAWRALQPLKDEELSTSAGTLACVRAFTAATTAMHAAEKALLVTHPGATYVFHFPETTSIVCSAFMALDWDENDLADMHPYSVLGGRLSVLIQAAKALEGMAAVYCAFDDDDSIFGTYLADETLALGEAYRRRFEELPSPA